MAHLVVVGGGAAGMSAASVAKRRDPDLEVTVLEAGSHISFSACGMPYWVAGEVAGSHEDLIVLTPEDAAKRGVDARVGTTATAVDPEERTVDLEGPEGPGTLAWDHLVLAPGVKARDPFDALSIDGVHGLRHLDDGRRLMADLELTQPERAVIVGGGFIGLEMAEALVARGIETTLIHSQGHLLNELLDEALGTMVNEAAEEAGIELVLGAYADGVTEAGGRVDSVNAAGEAIDCEVAVLAIGAEPRTELASAAGCTLGPTGAIAVDDQMRSGVDDIYACGDCVEFQHRITGEPTFLPLALHANRSGRVAGEVLTGHEARFPGVLGTAVTRFEDLEIAATGLGLQAAEAAGFDAVAETISSVTKAGYFPGADEIHARMVVEQGTGRVLGCQLVGGKGSGKRIDTVAAAMWMEATAEDLEAMDLAYAPPVSPTWDPVAIAARIAGKKA